MSDSFICNVLDAGIVSFNEAYKLQLSLVESMRKKNSSPTLILLEHPHVISVGRSGNENDLKIPKRDFIKQGVEVVHADRGGETTYHGPGQIIGYPIIKISNMQVRNYVRSLETVMIRTLKDFGVDAITIPKKTGVWINNKKIGSIGIKISRGISYHGFALNVNVDLKYFKNLIVCGDVFPLTSSMEQELGRRLSIEDVKRNLSIQFCKLLDFTPKYFTD